MHKLSDNLKVYGASAAYNGLEAQTLNNSNDTGTYMQMGLHDLALFCCHCSAMAAGASVTFQVMQATDAAGTGAKVVTVATTTIAQATDGTNVTKVIDLNSRQLDVANGFDWVAIKATETATANATVCVQAIRTGSRYSNAGMTVGT